MTNPEEVIETSTIDAELFKIRISTGEKYADRVENSALEPSTQAEIQFLLEYYDTLGSVPLEELNQRVETAKEGIATLIRNSSGTQVVESLGGPFKKTIKQNTLQEIIAKIRAISFMTSPQGAVSIQRLRGMVEESITLEEEFTPKVVEETETSGEVGIGFSQEELDIIDKNIDGVHHFYMRFRKAQDSGLFAIKRDETLISDIKAYLDNGFSETILRELARMNNFQWTLEENDEISYKTEQYIELFKGMGNAGRGMVIEGIDNEVRSNQIFLAMVRAKLDFYTVESYTKTKRPPKSEAEYTEIIQRREADYQEILKKQRASGGS